MITFGSVEDVLHQALYSIIPAKLNIGCPTRVSFHLNWIISIVSRFPYFLDSFSILLEYIF